MKEEKGLPVEVVKEIENEMNNDYGAHIQEGGKAYDIGQRLAQAIDDETVWYNKFYTPILQEKDAKIEKLMGLLENAFKAEWVNTITEAFADGAAAQNSANNEWNEYKLKNGLSE